jgi:hypothetical protein
MKLQYKNYEQREVALEGQQPAMIEHRVFQLLLQ